MNNPHLTFRAFTIVLVAFLFILIGCKSDSDTPSDPPPNTVTNRTCIECHSDAALLKTIAAPDTSHPTSEGGCGGELPPLEPWQKVYIGGPNGQTFLQSVHGKIKCVDCHRGTEPASDKVSAHAGNFVASPSITNAVTACGSCHKDIADKNAANIHTQGFGQKAMVALRSGLPNYEAFHAQLKAGYDKNCGKCHASCGECHIQRPKQAGGGFLSAHLFQKPDMRLNCTACHAARVANAYFGESFGTKPDVHYLKLTGGQCTNCHTAQEMHGDGSVYTQRYTVKDLPQCEDCHTAKATSNAFHLKHWNDISCYTCHSQEYQNCGSCHVGTGVRKGPYMGFKIAMNPLPNVKRFKYVIVRNAPHAPDTWSNFGIPSLVNFAFAPTFKLASPHNILRTTERTTVEAGKPCFDACHISNGKNKQWFLFQSDLQSWEVPANQPIVVDGKLPASWK